MGYNRSELMQPEASNTPLDSRPETRGMSELARIGGVYFEPKTAFADIAARPTWLTPMVISILVSLIVVYLMGRTSGGTGSPRRISRQARSIPK